MMSQLQVVLRDFLQAVEKVLQIWIGFRLVGELKEVGVEVVGAGAEAVSYLLGKCLAHLVILRELKLEHVNDICKVCT